ncbi:MAG TPA: hypothetical protein VEP89_03245 [Draconibacterium sp.]|nr:hypothetical protein [Draconibacterium sp.]
MLRKTSHIILLIVFMVSTMGMTISRHYCGNNLKSVNIFAPTEKCCDIPVGCCHNENVSVQIEKDYTASSIAYDFSTIATELPDFAELFVVEENQIESETEVFVQLPIRKTQAVLASLQTYLL